MWDANPRKKKGKKKEKKNMCFIEGNFSKIFSKNFRKFFESFSIIFLPKMTFFFFFLVISAKPTKDVTRSTKRKNTCLTQNIILATEIS